MIYSPHTFEITLNLNKEKFNELLSEAFKKAKM